jgi:hypothetical protein
MPGGGLGRDPAGAGALSRAIILVQDTQAALEQRLENLEATSEQVITKVGKLDVRLMDVENKNKAIDELTAYLGGQGEGLAPAPKKGGLTVQAPFTIVGTGGQPVATIADAGGGMLTIFDSGGQDSVLLDGKEQAVTVASDAGKATLGSHHGIWGLFLGDASGQPSASLENFSDGSASLRISDSQGVESILLDGSKQAMTVASDKGKATLGTHHSDWGLFLGDGGGKPTADLSQPSGRGMALRIFAGGPSPVAAIGASKEGGAVRVFSQSGGPAAVLDAMGDGTGLVQVYKSGEPTAALVGHEPSISIYNSSGISVASLSLSSSGSGGNMTTRDASGKGVFSAGAASDGGGEACVTRVTGAGKVRNECVGIGLPSMGLAK